MADVILFRCHELGEQSRHLFGKLRNELPGHALFAVGYVPDQAEPPQDDAIPAAFYDRATLETLPYRTKLGRVNWASPIGDNDLPVMQFFRDHPGYDHYWIIEYDVHYSGSWQDILRALSGSAADLLATNILDHRRYPSWAWWDTIEIPGLALTPQEKVKAFLPFARASARLLQELDRRYQDGWTGHYEAVWPIAARLAGMVLEDVGGNSPYTPAARRHKHYTSNSLHWALYPGTFQYRPCYRFGEMMEISRSLTPAPMLWHPVK